MEVPKRAIKFSSNDTFGPRYQRLCHAPVLTQPLAVLTGASAGAVESLVVVSFELPKIRLQDKTSASHYHGLLGCLIRIIRHEGPLALYNGFEATLWRHIMWNAGYFGCIFQVRTQMHNPATAMNSKAQKMVNDLAAGFVGGVVKSRIQNVTKVEGARAKYEWAWPSLGIVAKEEGLGALYKGYLAKILRFDPGGGVLLIVYSAVAEMLGKIA